jgi:hypothetical protein
METLKEALRAEETRKKKGPPRKTDKTKEGEERERETCGPKGARN